MPKPRYVSTIDYVERIKRPIDDQEEDKDWHNVSLRKELNSERDKLPKLNEDSGRRQKMYSEVGHKRGFQREPLINRLMEPIKVEEEARLKGKKYK